MNKLPKQAIITWTNEVTIHSAGFVVDEDTECYTIAHDYHDGFWESATRVPKANVKSIQFMRKGK